MKRKMWATALAASMVISAFSGMTVSAEEADSDLSGTLTILSWYDETKAAPVLEAFKEKYPNVNVDFQYSPPVQDYVEKLSTLLYSGAGPDIFYMSLENREDLIKGNYCLDLSEESYMTDGTIPDSVKTTYGKDGKAYALAVDCWVGGILINEDLFEQAGIEGEPTTWDEFLEVCQKLQDAGITPIMDNCQDAAVNFTAPLYGSEVAINVGLCINSASENTELAKAFLDFAASPEGLEKQYQGYGGFTIAEGYTPDLPAQITDAVEAVKEGKYYIPMADWLSYTESLRLTYIQSLQDCMAGTITPEEAATRLDDKLAEVSAE